MNIYLPFTTQNGDVRVGFRAHRDVHAGNGTGVVLQQERIVVVDAAPVQLAHGLDFIRITQQPGCQGDEINAGIEQHSAAQFFPEHIKIRVKIGQDCAAGKQVPDIAYYVIFYQFLEFNCRGDETGPHRLHEKELPFPCKVDDRDGFHGIDGKRFFT